MRRLTAFALSYCAAVFAAQYLVPRRFWLPAGVLCALFSLLTLLFHGDRRLRLLLIALGLAAGFLWCRGYDAVFYEAAEELDGHTVVIDATVTDWPKTTDYGFSVPVRIRSEGRPAVKAVLYADESAAALRPGDSLSVIAACRLADRTKSGEEITVYTSRGVFLIATSYGETTVTSPEHIPFRYWPQLTAKALKESIGKVFSDAAASSFMTALITGDKSELDDSVYAALRRTGLAHVVAVSGLHISFLAGLLRVLSGRRRSRISAAVSIGIIFFFAAVTGNNPSVLRAAFQCACLQTAPLLGREEDTPTALSAILAALLFQNPRAAANIGLQLSFAAVAGIYLFAPALYDRWTKRLPGRKWINVPLRFVIGVLSTTLGAIVFTTPISAYYFGTVSLVAPLSNLLAHLAVTAAFTAGLITALIGIAFPGMGGVLPVRYLQWLVPALSKVPFAAVTLGSVYYALWLLFAYTVLCLYAFWRGEKKRPLFPICAGTVVLCAAVFFTRLAVSADSLVVSVLDVGQGQSIALCSGRYAALVDCGGNGAENAGDVAADYLQNLGRTTLDLLVLTHCHEDHAGGVAELVERLDVKTVAMPEPEPDDTLGMNIRRLAEQEGAEIRYITEQDQIALGKAAITLYPPLGGEGENEQGLSVLCTSGDFDLLITGDMSAEIEARLIKYSDLPDIELFVAGHHGSRYSTSEALLDAVTPELAVISVGNNTYGHPAGETLSRLAENGIAVYRTDLRGTVTVTVR